MVVSKRQIFFSCHKEIHENEHFLSVRNGDSRPATLLQHFNSRGQTFNFLYRQVSLCEIGLVFLEAIKYLSINDFVFFLVRTWAHVIS